MIRLGLEVFLKSNVSLIEGKKVGLLTNQTGVDNELNSIIDLFYNNPRIKLTAIFAPEHGIRNEHQAGVGFQSYVDKIYGEGCFESLCSGTGIARRTIEEIRKGSKTMLMDIVNNEIDAITSK
ncbi:unnamed protein product, partial [marine sediment metagenome]